MNAMLPTDIAILLTFWILVSLSLSLPHGWQRLQQKPAADWLLDLCGLAVQGILIPALQIGLLYQVLATLLPQWENSVAVSSLVSFLFCFIAVDYAYYWNHRWLHSFAWPLHRVHHTVTQLDVFGSSRNSLWSSFFILYLWVHTLMIYLLQDSNGYLWGISLTAMLDLWRHSLLGPSSHSKLCSALSPWLVLPQDHALHHSHQHSYNFGANLKVWDRLHGTSKHAASFPCKIGVQTSLTFWQKLLFPFEST